MVLTPGGRLGPYEIMEMLGRGGMGEVFRAHDSRLNRTVAIKVSSGQFSDRFEREARAVAALSHPNVCTLFDIGRPPADPGYLVMEFVEGQTLAKLIKRGPMPVGEVLPIASQIAAALEAAHERGIVHRDLKPGNVMIRGDGAVKVLDFGLAKQTLPAAAGAVDGDSPTLITPLGMTSAGLVLGTASYMSPEQARGKEVDRRSDIWAFGVVLYEMVTGIQPFQGADLADTLASVVRDTPDWSRVPAELRHLLSRCLEKDPNQRLRHIGDVMELVTRPTADAKRDVGMKTSMLWPVSAAVLALCTGLALWAPWRSVRDSVTRASVTRLAVVAQGIPDTDGNNQFGSAISPDGTTLAFVGRNGESGFSLYLRPLSSLEARSLPEGAGATRPFWSPDSKYVAWFARRALWRMAVAGGAVEKITDIAGTGRGGTWNRDGVILFADQNNGGINRVPAAGGPVVLTTQFDAARGEDAHYYPQFLPDGRHFLYYRRSKSNDRAGMYVGTLDDPKKGAADLLVLASEYRAIYGSGHLIRYTGETLVAQPFNPATFALTGSPVVVAGAVARISSNAYADMSASDNGVLAYCSANNSERTLRWLDRTGKTLSTVGASISDGNIKLSPDGTRVLGRLSDRSRQGNWVLNLERGTRTRVTFDPPYNDAVWSPSGNEIAWFMPGREGQVYTRAADGSGVPRKVPGALLGRGQLSEWTADGRLLWFGAGEQAQDIFETPAAGGKPRILIGGPGSQGQARLSNDGRWIAYASTESSRSEIYVAGNNGDAGKWQISANGGSNPHWRRDGREIVYQSPDGLVSVPVMLSASSVALGKPATLFAPAGPWDVASDFSRVLVAMPPENQNSSFIILQNWNRLLK
jgi:eukaryotic-like serine/threonine-protein kinase